jgi:protein-S-isoprenylcysteine O-methyltransferase Ste14
MVKPKVAVIANHCLYYYSTNMNFSYLYFQMSILILFSVLVGGRILYLRFKQGINAVSVVRNKGIQRILGITVITIINSWVAILLVYILHPEIDFLSFPLNLVLLNSLPCKIFGISIICLGLAIYIAAWFALRNTWRIGQDYKHKSDLITNGIYKMSRNPMYLFYNLYFVGSFFVNGALVFLILAVLLITNLHYLIIQEEKSLYMTYGIFWEKYSQRTGRYLTWNRLLPMKSTIRED